MELLDKWEQQYPEFLFPTWPVCGGLVANGLKYDFLQMEPSLEAF